MWMIATTWGVELVLMVITLGAAQQDSLRSALNAVDRRQKDLSESPGYGGFYTEGGLTRLGYGPDERNELAFLNSGNARNNEQLALERALMDYLEENDAIERESIKKRFSSPFRERVEADKARHREELAEILLNKLDNEHESSDDDEYEGLLKDLIEKYRDEYTDVHEGIPRVYSSNEIKKRVFPSEYYTNLGYDSIGMKKRSRYFEPDGPSESLYLLNYAPRDEVFNRLQEADDVDEDNDYYKWNPNSHLQRERKRSKIHYPSYYVNKRFPVTKRSSPPIPNSEKIYQQHKRSSNKDFTTKTDPKVAKELSSIFGSAKNKKVITDKPKKSALKGSDKITKPRKTEHTVSASTTSDISAKKEKEQREQKVVNTKEIAHVSAQNEPLQIKKKSIDWSDYFGLDRRKKSDNDIDNEWLMERYHKAVAMATKRSGAYPLQNFRNHDQARTEGAFEVKKKESVESEDMKLGEMDSKLKKLEDSIVDDALKYTGAHEGTTDSKEIQEVKDRVISRLAAAYNLEKMRQALGEYKKSIAKQKSEKKEMVKSDDMSLAEEKRVSVPRKQAVDEEREKTPEGDNNIKCSQGDEDCDEQTYKAPSEIVEQIHWVRGECAKVQRACNEVADVLGSYGHMLEMACNIHQTCLLCGENSWFAPTRQCNMLYLTKADELCDGDLECQKVARHAVRYLLDVNRSLRADPLDECDLNCPDNRR